MFLSFHRAMLDLPTEEQELIPISFFDGGGIILKGTGVSKTMWTKYYFIKTNK